MNIGQGIIIFVVLIFSLSVHESAHAWAADRLGDPTAKLLGRISLNPIVHIDIVGTIIFPLLAIFANFPVFGWAKPVPVNPGYLRNPRQDGLWISAAGPLSNFVLCAISFFLLKIVQTFFPAEGIGESLNFLFAYGVLINAVLGAFNFLPVPPLDGSKVLMGLVGEANAQKLEMLEPFGFIILYALLFLGVFRIMFSFVFAGLSVIASVLGVYL